MDRKRTVKNTQLFLVVTPGNQNSDSRGREIIVGIGY